MINMAGTAAVSIACHARRKILPAAPARRSIRAKYVRRHPHRAVSISACVNNARCGRTLKIAYFAQPGITWLEFSQASPGESLSSATRSAITAGRPRIQARTGIPHALELPARPQREHQRPDRASDRPEASG